MLLSYHPAGQDAPQVFEIRLELMRSAEIEAIEARTGGWEFGGEFREKLLKGSALARRALLWTMLRRQHPFIKFAEVDFADGEVTLELDLRELAEQRDQVVKMAAAGAVDPEDRDLALTLIDAQVVEFRTKHGIDEDAEGKAPTAS